MTCPNGLHTVAFLYDLQLFTSVNKHLSVYFLKKLKHFPVEQTPFSGWLNYDWTLYFLARKFQFMCSVVHGCIIGTFIHEFKLCKAIFIKILWVKKKKKTIVSLKIMSIGDFKLRFFWESLKEKVHQSFLVIQGLYRKLMTTLLSSVKDLPKSVYIHMYIHMSLLPANTSYS